MKFKNIQNTEHKIDGRTVWESRSVAVVGVILIYRHLIPYVLISKRGPNSADFQGKWNLIAGYLDWNETGYEALVRETWEEAGFDLDGHLKKCKNAKAKLLGNDLEQPWAVNTSPSINRENVSLRYGVSFQIDPDEDFPILTTEHNEVEGECEEPMWLSLYDDENFKNYEWAFNHDQVIEDYWNYLHEKK